MRGRRVHPVSSGRWTRFDAELGARVSGFAPVLLRSEAFSSSQIENLTASARAVFSAELGAKGSRNAGDVAANAAAMSAALRPGEVRPAERISALVAVAVAHAQWETIHPFTDGNGRGGRTLAQSMLWYRGVTRNAAVPVSAGLLADVECYHAVLTAYREGEVDPRSFTFVRPLSVEDSAHV